ncbi:uncharacterized protein [Dermacentor andersoni]|uniref:uncharacterized protein n=1 Tax=Dermacentor andersoni TaxID=34620 RepID=UPI003B3BB112
MRNNGHTVDNHSNRTVGAPNAATLRRQKIERRRRQMWFDCDCARQTVLFHETSSLPRAFGSGSRGKRGKRRKVGCRIICIFLVNRYKHDSSWMSLFEANSSSDRGGGIANAAATSGGNGTFHGPTGEQTGGASRRLNAAGLSIDMSGMHGAGIVGSGGVRTTNNLATGPAGVSITNAPTSGGGMEAGAVTGKGNGTVVGIGAVKNAASGTVMTGVSIGNISQTISSVSRARSERNGPVRGDATGSPLLVIGGPPDSRKNGTSTKGANGVEVGSTPLGTGSVGSVSNAGGSRTIARNNSAATGAAPSSVSAGGLSGISATGAAGIVSTTGNIVSSTGLSGSNTHSPGGASIESGSGLRNTAVGVVGSGSSTVVNTTSLLGSRLGINNGGLSNESVRNGGSTTVRGTERYSALGGGTVSTNGAGQGIGSFGRGVAASSGTAFPGSKGAMNATAREGGVRSHGGVGSSTRGIGNGGGSNVHSNQEGTSVSGGTVNSNGGSASVAGGSAGNTGMETRRATLSTAVSRVAATTATESRRVLTVVAPGGAASSVTGSLVEGSKSNGAVVSGTGMSAGLTGNSTVLSGINGVPPSASSSPVLTGSAGAASNDTGISVHSAGNGGIGIGRKEFPQETGGLPNSGSEAAGGATAAVSSSIDGSRVLGAGTSGVRSSVGLLNSAGVPSGSTLILASPTSTITTSVVSGIVSPGSRVAGSGSAGNHGIATINTGLPNGRANTPVISVVGSSAGASNVGVGGVANNVSRVTIAGVGIIEGSTGGGGTGVVTGHASSASEGVRIGPVGNPDSGIGNAGSSGGSATVPDTSAVESSAGQGSMAVSGASGRGNIPAAAGTTGSSAIGSVTAGLPNARVSSPLVTTLAGGGMSRVTIRHEEGVGAGFSSNRGIATPTDRLASGGANGAASAGSGGTGKENEVGGEASSTLGTTNYGVAGRPTDLRVSGGSEAAGGVSSSPGVEIGNVSAGTSNGSISTGVPGGNSLPSSIDKVPVVREENGAALGTMGSTSSVGVGPASGVTASTETVAGGSHGSTARPSGVVLPGSGAGAPTGSVSGAVSGGVVGVYRGGEASSTLGTTNNGVAGHPTDLRVSGGSEAAGGVSSSPGVEMGNVSAGTSNGSISTGVPGGNSLPSSIDKVPGVREENGAALGTMGSTSSVGAGPASGVTASTETVTGGSHGSTARPSGVALPGTGAGAPTGSVSGAVSGGVVGVYGGLPGSASRNTNAGSSEERTRPSLSTSSPEAGIGSAGSGAGREVGAPVVLSAGRNEVSSGSPGNRYGADSGGGEGLGAGSISNGMPFSFGGENGGRANGFGSTGGGMSGGTWSPLGGAYNNMGLGYGSSRFAGGFGSMAGMQPYGGGNFGMGGVYPVRAAPRRNIEIYDDDIFFQD